ncbi:MAG: ABC transporter permease [Clostridia bacterium]|nr:ABC transporter permease [Clostridia bacterium]NCC44264.1 ABC transporter permease [Clostridia bacterium]
MRKVANGKAIRHLAKKSFFASKTRNLIAVVAIALTAMLFSSLFTIGMGTIENFQKETMRQSGGDSHGTIKYVTREQYDKMSQDPLIRESADCEMVVSYICNPEFLKRHVEAWYVPESFYPHCFINLIDGRAPQSADEILLDDLSLELMGKEAKAGQDVTIQMKIRSDADEMIERTFHVSGVTKADPAMNTGFIYVAKSYLDVYADELAYTYWEDYSLTGTIRMDVIFDNSFNIQEKLNKVIENAGYSSDEGSEGYIASNANWAYVSDGGSTDPITMIAGLGGLFLIMLTGYLIIYNIFQISVIRDIRYYGLLKTIGTTGKQIKKILRWQALILGVIGIPVGLLGGFFIGKGIVPKVMKLSSFSGENTSVTLNAWIFLGAAVFTMLTVWISTGKPARIAAKVSPVEAVRYTEGSTAEKKHGKPYRYKGKKSTNGGKLWRMAFSNLGRSKRRTILVILSLSLAVVLLNSVFTLTHAFDMNKYIERFSSSDFLIGNAQYFNGGGYIGGSEEQAQEEKVSETFVSFCQEQDGFVEGGKLYGSMGEVKLKKDSWTPPENIAKDENGNPGKYWNGVFAPLDEWNEEYLISFYGMEDYFYDKIEIYKGEQDPETIKEKLKTGDYLLSAVPVDDNGYVETEEEMVQPGEKVTLVGKNGQEKEYEILSLIKENYYGMTNRIGSNFCFYASADEFVKMASDQFLMSYAFDAEDDKESVIAEALETYTTQEESIMDYESKQFWLDEFSGMVDLFVLVGGILSIVVGMIGVLNFINSILTSIVTRQREFAMLEAIGMTKKQRSLMLIFEGVCYAVGTVICSVIVGILFSLTALQAVTKGLWFMSYKFVIWPVFMVAPILLVLGVIVPALALKCGKKESVVERLRKVEV